MQTKEFRKSMVIKRNYA